MHFIVVGASFKTANVEKREKLHFSSEALPAAYSQLNSNQSINGSVILSTCNRVEIYASTDNIDKGIEDITNFISNFHKISLNELKPILYSKNCHSAVFHLLTVTSSIDSMVIGESQIQGQVRDAYAAAQELNATNGMVNKLFQSAIQTGKKVRNETKIGEGSVSVATLALDIIKKYYGQDEKFSALIVGSGKMGSLTASNFRNYFTNLNLSIANRSLDNAKIFAEKFDAQIIDFDDRYNTLKDFDVMVVATSFETHVIKHSLVEMALAGHLTEKKRYFVDLAIPRNIDPHIRIVENCSLYSIDDINKIITTNLDKRSESIERAKAIINEVAEEYFEWYLKQSIVPTMMEIKKGMGIIKDRTIATFDDFYKTLESSQAENVSKMLDEYADKIIKVIMKNIRRATTKDELINITRTLKETLTLDINNDH
ncbi:MAG: glutamyl-tRNA reductase [Candidatus Kapabacteria bacterium]|nr:glutamyl-tRNA reductase [Candidatus Kapabacteria bacterium]